MTTSYLSNNRVVEAIIRFKNGTKKYGVLVDNSLFRSDAFHFISNSNFQLFSETNNPEYIEVLPGKLIASIETDLK
ncbi:MAG: hypothetical protein WAQ28_11040 [Bacteroidia bacterium]